MVRRTKPPARVTNEEALVCELDGHTWFRERKRGKKPVRCPQHKEAPERDPVAEAARNKELAEEKLARSREVASNLDAELKRRGTHVSQHPESNRRSHSIADILDCLDRIEAWIDGR